MNVSVVRPTAINLQDKDGRTVVEVHETIDCFGDLVGLLVYKRSSIDEVEELANTAIALYRQAKERA